PANSRRKRGSIPGPRLDRETGPRCVEVRPGDPPVAPRYAGSTLVFMPLRIGPGLALSSLMDVEGNRVLASLTPPRLVVPVRYVAGGTAVHTTSSELNPEAIHVRTAWP